MCRTGAERMPLLSFYYRKKRVFPLTISGAQNVRFATIRMMRIKRQGICENSVEMAGTVEKL